MLWPIAFLLFLTTRPTLAHIALSYPCPRYNNAHGEDCPPVPEGQQVDYSITSPLGNTDPLCKRTVPYPSPSAQWTAGQSITVKFYGTARHNGGHCQFSMSYDGGQTFVVVHEILRYCLYDGINGNALGNPVDSYTFDLPKDLPSSSNAVFAWTWVNASGNREFYMNCADVTVAGNSNSYSGKQMTIANHQGYATIPEFRGNYDTGLDMYESAPVIKVTGNGQTTGSVSNNTGVDTSSNNNSSSSSSVSSSANASTNVNPDNLNSASDEVIVNKDATANQQVAAAIGIPVPVLQEDDLDTSASDTSSVSSSAATYVYSSPVASTLAGTASSEAPASSPSPSPSSSSSSSSTVPGEFKAVKPDSLGQCALGEMRCGTDTSTFDTCDIAGWITRACAPGTSCKMTSGGGSPCV
ncbi:hypothetical protein H4R99_006262 [Coemansia sp. RSA 1722]|nr:hypothetical protein LPJ57_002093 [Coemansia sp. RSA 486]KAJ2237472.1 hypothetical protein IWW45_000922 [Coemansia sp. RSA 485]KAJ2592914.1 hypothetical protein H4R99_006262 [Coemansia sp. RSA 1722]KAJ2596482.1 hypothetical protein GGF39_003432 [Coemansia sp. RSA 1721]